MSRWRRIIVDAASARRLMDRALEHIESGGRWAVLQVYARNDAASNLYDGLGFEYLGGKSELLLDPATQHRPTGQIQIMPAFLTSRPATGRNSMNWPTVNFIPKRSGGGSAAE